MKKGILVLTVAAAVLTAGMALADGMPKLSGKAYVAGHGGHLAVLDLATMELDKLHVTVDPGLDAEGKPKPIVGTHGHTKIGDNLYVGLLNGKVTKVGLADGKITDLGTVGKKLCGAIPGPGGLVYFEDMADGNVYAFDPAKEKLAEMIPVGKSLCGIGFSADDKYGFASDMVQGNVYVIDMKTKRTVKTIEDVGTFLHQGRTNPDKSEFWVTAANEFKQTGDQKEKWALEGKGASEIVIIDTATQKIKERFATEEGSFPHDLAFTQDGKYALITARTYTDDSIMTVYDVKTKQVVGEPVSLCKTCHDAAGVVVKLDSGSPLLCGIEVDWAAK